MTRYNSEANEPYVNMREEHIPPEQLEGYREAVNRILLFLDQGGESGTAGDVRWAIKEGII